MKENWKPLPLDPDNYEISSLGRIKSKFKIVKRISKRGNYTRKSKILKYGINTSGYCQNAISNNGKLKSFSAHRQVAIAFIPNPFNKETVNHINGIKTDNRVENLEWATLKENIKHAVKNGLVSKLKGEQIGNSVAKEWQVLAIRKYVKEQNDKGIIRYGRKKLSKRFDLTESCVKDIISKRSWKHI